MANFSSVSIFIAEASSGTAANAAVHKMVRKEIGMHLLACNLIRGVMRDAAETHDKVPRGLGFQGAFQTMTAFQDALRWATARDQVALVGEMLKAISSHEVGDRFGRVEPRAKSDDRSLNDSRWDHVVKRVKP